MAIGRNGTDVLILARTSAVGVTPEVFTAIGSQRDASISESNDTIDHSSKDMRAEQSRPGRYSATVECESLWLPSDAALSALRAACRNGTMTKVRRSDTAVGGVVEEAEAWLESLDTEFPDQGEATVSITAHVSGVWT